MDFDVDAVLARINLCIEIRGWTKEEFYEKSGIKSASFSQWNTKRHMPTKKKLLQAAECLGVSLEYLLTGDSEKADTNRGGGFSGREIEFIQLFRQLPEEQQTFVIQQLQGLLRGQ